MPDYDLLPCGVISLNLNEKILAVNSYIIEKLGYTFSELENTSINSILSTGSRILYKTHFYPTLMGKGKVQEIVLSLTGKDGTKYPFLFNMSMDASQIHISGLILNKRSDFESGLIEAKNAAETALLKNKELMLAHNELGKIQKELESQLREEKTTNKELRILNKMISHDLQEPLRKIQLFASRTILKADSLNSMDDVLHNLNKIIEVAGRGHSLTKRLQQYSELEYYTLRKAHVNLTGIIESIKTESPLSTYDFIYDLEINSLYGDEDKITILFTELFHLIGRLIGSNGVKSMNLSSRISAKETKSPTNLEIGKLKILLMVEPKINNEDAKEMVHHAGGHRMGINLDMVFCEKITSLHGGTFNIEILDSGKIRIAIMLPHVSL
ncbi:hypothetical protein [Maribacter litoralis]|uniref:Uncharacterized protein n=1 Tax=Maribacter litoralis TaxID=2059726 RepID=A0A653W7C0_9FLAO|nr:hypothetical protein [Maribacter litoralis]VXC14377.1 conserved hypothetical protein [Maribacter litoralis]